MGKLNTIINLISNMGWRYMRFRVWYEIKKRTGLLKLAFPTSYTSKEFISFNKWKESAPKFFFQSREELGGYSLSAEGKIKLKEEFDLLKAGKLRYFSSKIYDLGENYDWITNPDTGYKYNRRLHWTKIPDFDSQRGDIKYVWEKSRFSFLYTIIRYDKHFGEDQAEFVFQQISNWIDKNPLNCGPNYVCSQETSLRVLNWTFALYYYRESPKLTEEVFQKIVNSIYWQVKHVESNINFSRIAVRNNHAITETLMLLLAGVLFPFFPNSKRWLTKGKKYFEEEVLYQVYRDGSYIQYSMNYQRVAVQLFTWAVNLTKINQYEFKEEVYNRINKCSEFLFQLQDASTGELPNYGANDGALFFPLNACNYRDYRPQLNALQFFTNQESMYPDGDWNEDLFWIYGISKPEKSKKERESSSFNETGYYTLRGSKKFAFLRCGNHKDRPSQADNLHLDLWVDGVNLLRDAGSYKYNTTPENIRFFMGTASHNTVQIGKYDQMLKGGRFIWYNWSRCNYTKLTEDSEWIVFEGEISAYQHINPKIKHRRIVRQHKTELRWEIEDWVFNNSIEIHQIWNLHPQFFIEGYEIESFDADDEAYPVQKKLGYYSSYYGVKEKTERLIFTSHSNYFKTKIFKK